MQLGCNTVLFGATDLKTALQHLEWAGYRYVELAAIKGMCEHVGPGADIGALFLGGKGQLETREAPASVTLLRRQGRQQGDGQDWAHQSDV